MKKLLISLFIFLVVALGITILMNSISNPTVQKENTFLSLNNELTITLPPEFQVSTYSGVKDKYNSKSIFIATSSEDFLSIKITNGDETLNQREFVDLIVEEMEQTKINKTEEWTIVWSEMSKTNFGQNYYVYHDGIRYRTLENQPIQENIRQYITSYRGKGYIIDFINYLPNPNKSTYWDQIVSSISFK